MDTSYQLLKPGIKVWWSDPDHDYSSGVYEVVDVKCEDGEGLYDDTIVVIGNENSEAEVELWELQDLTIRQRSIKQLVDKIITIAQQEGWAVYNYSTDFAELELEFSKYSRAGQDFIFCVHATSGAIHDFLNEMEKYIDGYDPEEVALLWIGDDGHGKNGAPYHIADIVNDMIDCKNNMQALFNVLTNKLNDKSNEERSFLGLED